MWKVRMKRNYAVLRAVLPGKLTNGIAPRAIQTGGFPLRFDQSNESTVATCGARTRGVCCRNINPLRQGYSVGIVSLRCRGACKRKDGKKDALCGSAGPAMCLR